MKIKYYKTTEKDIIDWYFSKWSCSQYDPYQIIEDLKTGNKDWYYNGIPLRLKPLKGSENTDGDKNTLLK